MESQIGEKDIAASGLLKAVAGPRQSDFEHAARDLHIHLAGSPGWVPLTPNMFPYAMPVGWSGPMVRLRARSIDVAIKRPRCHLSSDATRSMVLAVSTDILPETVAAGVRGKPATVIYGEHAPFNLDGWTIDSAVVSGLRTKVFIKVPTSWVSVDEQEQG
jgi:hypothetical protein